MKTKLICADTTKVWPVDNNAVDLIVTSPPYWCLKDYNTRDKQIGYYDSFNTYLNKMADVYQECIRVLKAEGFLCTVTTDLKTTTSPYEVIPINALTVSILSTLGMVYEGSIIWRKTARKGNIVNPMFPFPLLRFNYEMIHIFRKTYARSILYKESIKAKLLGDGIISTHNPVQKAHPAAFPLAIPMRLIEMYSIPNSIVLDPFVGSGTTGLACKKLRRDFIGIDNNLEYLTLTGKRLKIITPCIEITGNQPSVNASFTDAHSANMLARDFVSRVKII